MKTMKSLIASALFAIAATAGLSSLPTASYAQAPKIQPSALQPHLGFIRKGPCGSGAGDNCGSNPPTFKITPAMCGTLFSTSNARNADGSISTAGMKFNLPTVAEFTAAGYTGSGALSNPISAFDNRSGQCEISFVQGAPEENYLRVGLYGVEGTDKFTPFAQGSYDFSNSEMVFPYRTPSVVKFGWNGTSWLLLSGSPSMAELMGQGQQSSHGQGRLFLVTADRSWNTVGSLIGSLAFCPYNGDGIVTNANGGFQLSHIPINCVYKLPTAGGPTNEWIVVGNTTSGVATGVTQGAAYAAGTAPDGKAYPAGNYVVLQQGTFSQFATGNTIEIHGVRMANGTAVDGNWIGKFISPTQVELHERIDPTSGVSVPSSFVAGDTWVAGGNSNFMFLTQSSISGTHETNPSNGVIRESLLHLRTVVGLARRGPTGLSGTYQDLTNGRYIASLYNPVEKKCVSNLTANRTTTSTTWVEVNSEIRCNFVYLSGNNTNSQLLGDGGRKVKYAANVAASNGTAANGCEFAVGFDGIVPETDVGRFTNPAGVSGNVQAVTVAGARQAALTETNHYATLLMRATTGGTCTAYSDSTSLSLTVWQ